jgi:hypothetical protein
MTLLGKFANFSGFHLNHHCSNAWLSGEAGRRVKTVIDFKAYTNLRQYFCMPCFSLSAMLSRTATLKKSWQSAAWPSTTLR